MKYKSKITGLVVTVDRIKDDAVWWSTDLMSGEVCTDETVFMQLMEPIK